MVVVRAVSAASLLLLALLSLPVGSAQDDGLVFVEVETDAEGDQPVGFWDVLSLSVAEPGDGTVALRATFLDLSQPDDALARFYFGFTAAGVAVVSGFNYDGTTVGRNIGKAILADSCTVDADAATGTCYWPYESLGVAPGDTLTEVWGFVDSCVPVAGCLPGDNIPGGVALDGWNTGGYPATYTLTGCTLADATACAPADAGGVASEAASLYENLTAPAFLHEFANATSDDYTLNFTVPWSNATIRQTAEVASGSANVTVYRDGELFLAFLLTNQTAPASAEPTTDGNGTADGNATSEGNATEDLPVLADAAGNWSIVIDYEDFVGRVGMELAQYVPTPAEAVTNVTDEPALAADASEDAPGPALPLLVLGLLAIALVRRR